MNIEWQAFIQVALAIVLEAAPFLLLGSLVAALVEVYLGREGLARWQPKHPAAAVALGLVAGMALPTCECGVVSLVRRLMAQGLNPRTAITYMLAGPVINPVVLASTYVAFRFSWQMVAARVFLVAVPAAVVGWWLGGHRASVLLRPLAPARAACACGCAHGHDHDGCVVPIQGLRREPRPLAVLRVAALEFVSMGKYLILGSLAAAAVKTCLPWSVLGWLEGQLVLAVVGLMVMAVLLSVCSEADAFVAASFNGFPPVAQAAFTAIGPMLDLKLIMMFAGAFRRPVVVGLALAPFLLVLALSVGLGLVWGG